MKLWLEDAKWGIFERTEEGQEAWEQSSSVWTHYFTNSACCCGFYHKNVVKPVLSTKPSKLFSPTPSPSAFYKMRVQHVCWVVISLCLQGRKSGQLASEVWCAVWWSTTVRPPWQSCRGPATPFPWRAAEIVSSPRQMEPPATLVFLPQAEKRWSTRWRWDGWDPDEVLLGGRWAGTGAVSAPPSPLCQHLGGGARALFLSSFLLVHTPERCWGTAPSPSLHQRIQTQFNKTTTNKRNSCLPFQKEPNCKVLSSQTCSSEDKLPSCVDSGVFLWWASQLTPSTAGGPAQPLLYRQQLQDKEVVVCTRNQHPAR